MKLNLLFLTILLLAGLGCSLVFRKTANPPLPPTVSSDNFKNGFNLVDDDKIGLNSKKYNKSLSNALKSGANWVAIVISSYQKTINSNEIYGRHEFTPTPEQVSLTARRIRRLGRRVMLKFHLDIVDPPHWRGDISFLDEKDWNQWFNSYSDFITKYIINADRDDVNLICIGNELTKTETQEIRWRTLIANVRQKFHGQLVYGANWSPGPDNIKWWDALDYVGVSAFYELTEQKNPSVEDLISAWQLKIKNLEKIVVSSNKSVIFTEVGYRSIAGANMRPWDWRQRGELSLSEQANLYLALYEIARSKHWLSGIFWWGWNADPERGGINDTNYTPRGKPAEKIIILFSKLKR